MRTKYLLALSLLLLSAHAWANSVTYSTVIDTSSLAGITGSLDFNFQPGPFDAQPATVVIADFGGSGVPFGPASLTGGATGSLPGLIQLQNNTGFNDYFQAFTFGSSVSFQIDLSGPALGPQVGTLSGSTFSFSIFSDAQGTMPALTTDTLDGWALTVNINPDGTTTFQDYTATQTPEPPSAFLVAGSMLLLLPLWGNHAFRFR